MAVKRKRSSRHQDETLDHLSDQADVSQSSATSGKKVRGRNARSVRTRTLVASDGTLPEMQPAAILESVALAEDMTPTSRSPRRTPHGQAQVEVVITTLLNGRTRSSRGTIQSPVSPHSPQGLSTSDHPSLQIHSQPANSIDSSSAPLEHAESSIDAQKRTILKSLQSSKQKPINAEPSVNDIAAQQLADLVDGTMSRAEGNSCLILGPRSSGKSKMVETCLDNSSTKAIILRLSGWIQTTDRHALREIAFQLWQQTGSFFLSDLDLSKPVSGSREEENPFLVTQDAQQNLDDSSLSLSPSSHLNSLVPALLTLKHPVIVILDAFDLFALHPRQSLLYCLLDTVQNCRASAESRGIAVIGITSRVDTIQLLEKRVKSRFSGRTIRTASSGSFEGYLTFIRNILISMSPEKDVGLNEEWNRRWTSSIERFLTEKEVLNIFKETFNLSRDFKLINRLLTACVMQLKPDQPYLTYKHVAAVVEAQRSRPLCLSFATLSYPSTCLLIASVHAETSGHPTFTFEMLFEAFRDQVRSSISAPVQVNGGSIGMVRCTREVLMSAFEGLAAANIFTPIAGISSAVAKEFTKHRCTLERDVVKRIVEKSGQVNLRKWFSKTQQS